ncbi:pentapeptide repeat-containing protein [Cylindrospermopsis raciborskii]
MCTQKPTDLRACNLDDADLEGANLEAANSRSCSPRHTEAPGVLTSRC